MNLYDEITVLSWKESRWMTTKQIAHRTCTDPDTVAQALDVLVMAGRFRKWECLDGMVLWGSLDRPPEPKEAL